MQRLDMHVTHGTLPVRRDRLPDRFVLHSGLVLSLGSFFSLVSVLIPFRV